MQLVLIIFSFSYNHLLSLLLLYKKNIDFGRSFYPDLNANEEENLKLSLEALYELSQRIFFNQNNKKYLD